MSSNHPARRQRTSVTSTPYSPMSVTHSPTSGNIFSNNVPSHQRIRAIQRARQSSYTSSSVTTNASAHGSPAGIDPGSRMAVDAFGEKLERRDLRVGMIIYAAIHKEESDQTDRRHHGRSRATSSACDRIRSGSLSGSALIDFSYTNCGVIHSKCRPMIVIAMFARHYITLPLGTHGGNGVRHMPEYIKQEYISVRDHQRFPEGEKFERQTAFEPLWTGELNYGHKVGELSTVHLTHPVPRSYGLRGERRGVLDGASTRSLVRLFHLTLGQG